jgi:hypothetical protein
LFGLRNSFCGQEKELNIFLGCHKRTRPKIAEGSILKEKSAEKFSLQKVAGACRKFRKRFAQRISTAFRAIERPFGSNLENTQDYLLITSQRLTNCLQDCYPLTHEDDFAYR